MSIYGDTTAEIVSALRWWWHFTAEQAREYINKANGGINNPLFAMLVMAHKDEQN